MKLSHRRFAQHNIFGLYAYDCLARQETWQQAHLMAEVDSSDNAAIAALTPNDVRIAVNHELACLEALQKGAPLPLAPSEISDACRALLRKVKSAAQNVTGTNEERKAMYVKVSSMRLLYGAPNFYLTVNVNETTAYAVLKYCGKSQFINLDNVTQEIDLDGHPRTLSNEERRAIIDKDPVAAAEFFEAVMDMVYGRILGIEQGTAKILRKGGVLGHVEHFFGSKETASRGALHEHILGWLLGFPRTVAKFEDLMKDNKYAEAMNSYLGEVVNASLPIDTTNVPCKSCHQVGTVKAVRVLASHRSKALQYSKSTPHLVKCTAGTCSYSASCHDWLKHCVESAIHEKQKLEGVDVDSEEAISERTVTDKNLKDILSAPELPSLFDLHSDDKHPTVLNAEGKAEEFMNRINLAKIIIAVQGHSANHTHTCFKNKASKTSCRMHLPCTCFFDTTKLDPVDFKLKIQRLMGCNYINKHNLIMTLLLRCNTDYTPLVLTDAGLIHYVCSYITKDQNAIEFLADAYASAIATRARAEETSNQTESDLNQRVASRLRGIIHNVTGKAQVSAPMAASKLLGHPTPYRSSEIFAPLYLIQLTKGVEGKPIQTRISKTSEGDIITTSFYSDFTNRPVGKHTSTNAPLPVAGAVPTVIDFDSMGSLYYVQNFEMISKKEMATRDQQKAKGKGKTKETESDEDDPERDLVDGLDLEVSDNSDDDSEGSDDEDTENPTKATGKIPFNIL